MNDTPTTGDTANPNEKPVLPNLGDPSARPDDAADAEVGDGLTAVYDVNIKVQAVLGRSRMDISSLMRLRTGDVVELDRRVGEPVDILVNNRMIARGEVVLVDGRLGVTLTEVVKQDR